MSIWHGIKTSAAPEDLYRVDEYFDKIITYKDKIFHNLVAKTLHNTKPLISDTCTKVVFLTTRVREPNKCEWGKLVNIMKNIRWTRDILLILSSKVSGVLKCWVGASYAVHPNMW